MTNILALPEIRVPIAIETGQDWIDAVAFTDASSAPVALDGIAFHLQVRLTAGDNEIFFEGTTADGSLQVLASAALPSVAAPGAGYAVGDLVHAPADGAIVPLALEVTAVGPGGAVASAILVDPGIYAALPANPVPQGSTTGAGSGASFALAWIDNALAIAVAAAALPAKFVAGGYVYGIQAVADGYTQTPWWGDLTLTDGIVR